ncbi:hypothetical protein SBC2_84990 (plasmid) [Caballeronia sp. SBC2]|nr:hypothetical protein SBC2_84990 [Caballeronia sp. SBC2]
MSKHPFTHEETTHQKVLHRELGPMEMAWGSGTTRLPRGSAIGASRFGRSGSKLKKASSSNTACK